MYILIEMQTNGEQTAIPPIITRTEWHEAEAEFHRLCSVAATSSVPVHTVMLVDEHGISVRPAEYYTHGGAD